MRTRVVAITSYCGEDNDEGCTDNNPCKECLDMCNVFDINLSDTHYSYDATYGWSFVVSGYPDRETCRQATLIANKHFPEQSEEHKKLEKEMVDFCRSIPIDRE